MARRSQASFFKGVARVFDLSGAVSRGQRSSFAADGQAIRSDWSAVGRDLSAASSQAKTQVSKDTTWHRSDGKPVNEPKQLRLIQ